MASLFPDDNNYCKSLGYNHVKLFEEQLIQCMGDGNYRHHDLFQMLGEYHLYVKKTEKLKEQLTQKREKISVLEDHVWFNQKKQRSFQGECGDKRTVQKTIEYVVSSLDSGKMSSMFNLLGDNQELMEHLVSAVLRAESLKSEIDYTIYELVSNPIFSDPTAKKSNRNSYLQSIQTLRLTISILFCYLRKSIHNQDFVHNIRNWLFQLTAVHSQLTSLEDHWFVLIHLLKCPYKISWGAPLIQINASMFDVPDEVGLILCLSVLDLILSPSDNQKNLLKGSTDTQKSSLNRSGNNTWVLVESDGEEATDDLNIRENDLIDILNQIPFKLLFRYVMKIQETEDVFMLNECDEQQCIKVINFNLSLIKSLAIGIKTYDTDRYRNFVKRLGLLIQHCIHYTFDYCNIFIEENKTNKRCSCEKISVKLDQFVLTACNHLYKSHCAGTTQFFQFVPFNLLRKRIRYALFYLLNVGFPDKLLSNTDYKALINKPDFKRDFNEKIQERSDEGLHFLLHTFLEMAVSSDIISDWDFIQSVSEHIFFIGFINETTRDAYYKTCKDILHTLTSVYPDLISSFIQLASVHVESIKYFDVIFKYLPIGIWKPDVLCLKILSQWLLKFSYESDESKISRIILEQVNWNISSDGTLYVPRDIHVYVACIIAEAGSKYSSYSPGSKDKKYEILTNQFVEWCWKMLLRLRLHYVDQCKPIPELMIKNPSQYLTNIPDLSEVNMLVEGIAERKPMAMYLAIQITLYGHSIPLICQYGFDLMYQLLKENEYIMVIQCIKLVTLLYVEVPDTLAECKGFSNVICKLIAMDQKQKHKGISTLETLRNMIQAQLINFECYGLETCAPILNIWLQCLFGLPVPELQNILYLLDSIFSTIYVVPNLWSATKNYISTMPSKIQLLQADPNYSKMQFKFPWYSLLILEVEHELFEIENNLWCELLKQYQNDKAPNLNQAFEEAKSKVSTTYNTPNDLVVFKYAQVIANIDHKHCLLPLLAQKFFLLLLDGNRFNSEEESKRNHFRDANKFYAFNANLFVKVKNKLVAAEDYYRTEYKEANQTQNISNQSNEKLSRLFNTFGICISICSGGKAYENQETMIGVQLLQRNLTQILIENKDNLSDFLDLSLVKKKITENVSCWVKYSCRSVNSSVGNNRKLFVKRKTCPKERIQRYLKSYEDPKQLQSLKMKLHTLETGKISGLVEAQVAILKKYSNVLQAQSNEALMLNKTYEAILKKLYETIYYDEVHSVRCFALLPEMITKCSKPAKIKVTVEVTKKNVKIDQSIIENRLRYNKFLDMILWLNFKEIISAAAELQIIVKHLTTSYQKKIITQQNDSQISKMLLNTFYRLVECCDEFTISYEPTKHVLRTLISSLAGLISNHQNTEGARIIKAAIKYRAIFDILSEIINPVKSDFECFVQMYKAIIDTTGENLHPQITSFLEIKFDLQFCLRLFKPDCKGINCLNDLVFIAFEKYWYHYNILTIYRQHLMQIFEYDFPEYSDKVFNGFLIYSTKKHGKPVILVDIINCILGNKFCTEITTDVYDKLGNLASYQRLNLNFTLETIRLFSQFYHGERLKQGIHGLYPKYQKYCQYMSILFFCFGKMATDLATSSNFWVTIDEYSNKILNKIFDMYTPWVCLYVADRSSDWSRNGCLSRNESASYPWSEAYAESAKLVVDSLVAVIKSSTSFLTIRNITLSYTFNWYICHFSRRMVPSHIHNLVCEKLRSLSWCSFYPHVNLLEITHHVLFKGDPEERIFIGYIFGQIPWTDWLHQVFITLNAENQLKSINILLFSCIGICLDPVFKNKVNIQHLIKSLLSFPLEKTTYNNLEDMYDWITATDPSSTLMFQSDDTNISILSLLKNASDMNPADFRKDLVTCPSKRVLYVRNTLEWLRKYGSESSDDWKNVQKIQRLKNVVIDILSCIELISSGPHRNSLSVTVLVELLIFLEGPNDTFANLLTEILTTWQHNQMVKKETIDVFLKALAVKPLSNCYISAVLESTMEEYFTRFDQEIATCLYGWDYLATIFTKSFEGLNLVFLAKEKCLLVVKLLFVYNMKLDSERRIHFLLKTVEMLFSFDINEKIEQKVAILWGAVLSNAFQLSYPLDDILKIASHMNSKVSYADSWSSSLLGFVGLQKHNMTKKFLVLLRCLSTIIYRLCDKRNSESHIQDLRLIAGSEKCLEIRASILICVKIIEECENVPSSITSKIFNIIQCFYNTQLVSLSRRLWESSNCKVDE